jgi:hypothetical protein
MMYELPDKYVEAERWAKELLERITALREVYQDPERRAYFSAAAIPERAAVKRTSLDLSRALSRMRKSGE